MPNDPAAWDSRRYLRFEEERTRPCRDLVGQIALDAPGSILDVGCGPGTSTAVLAERWPKARLEGVDRSDEMLAKARSSPVRATWALADVEQWTPGAPVDLVFSNAALQWLPDHARAVPRLWSWVAPRGALAFQVPVRDPHPPPWLAAITAVGGRSPWQQVAAPSPTESNVLAPEAYYDLIAPTAARVDLWDTEYDHVLEGPAAIVEWTRATMLRPWLAALASDAERSAYLADVLAELERRVSRRADGRVVFPFRRRFVVAYRGDAGTAPRQAL